jgi:hypothetical protein
MGSLAGAASWQGRRSLLQVVTSTAASLEGVRQCMQSVNLDSVWANYPFAQPISSELAARN